MKKPACFAVVVLTICMLMFVSGCKSTLVSPMNIQVDDNNNLSWTSVKDARTYKIEAKNVDSGEKKEFTSNKTSFSLSPLEEGDYEIRIKAIAGNSTENNNSDWSKIFPFHKDYETGCVYTLINNNSEYAITRVGSATGDLVIEDLHKGKPVTAIAENAFKGSSRLTSIVLGNRIKSIGKNAFYNCTKLASVTLPESLTEIGVSAFNGCRALKSITIPDGVKTIYAGTFTYCSELTAVNLGNGVTVIEENAFSDCIKLSSIVIPDSVISIGSYGFSGNEAMTSVTFGSGLTTIADNVFNRCISLVDVNFSANNQVTEIGEAAFSNCAALTRIALPEGLVSIGRSAFFRSPSLIDISLPESLTHMGAYAFNDTKIHSDAVLAEAELIYVGNWLVDSNAEYRETVALIEANTFQSGVVGIADQVFMQCKELGSVVFPSSLRYIGKNAFYICPKLWKITIPNNSVQLIDERAFYQCAVLVNVALGRGLTTIGERAFFGCSRLDNNSLGGSIIPDSVTAIGAYAFFGTALWNSPDNGIVYAGNWVVGFSGSNVTTVVLRAETVGISDYAFYKCETLRNITGAGIANVDYIGRGAFSGCTNLATLSLSDNLRIIEDFTFYKCSSLFRVDMPINLVSIGNSAFYNCETLTEINFSRSKLQVIKDYAFYGCRNMTEIRFGNSVTSIGNYAFYKCASITHVEIPDSTQFIGNRAFYKCELMESVSFGSGVSEIGDYAFSGCAALQSIQIPSSVKTIGNNAFYNCKAVTEITLEEGVAVIGNYAFYGLDKISVLHLPESVISIGNYAFKGCNGLSAIFIENTIRQIGAHAFYGCKEMTIYSNAAGIPAGWSGRWNSSYRPVVFGAALSEDGTYVVSVQITAGSILNMNAKGGISGPEREGYVFMGWATSSGSSIVEFSANDIAKVSAGTVLYAVWVVQETV